MPLEIRGASTSALSARTRPIAPGRGVLVFTWDDGTADHYGVAQAATARDQAHTFFVTTGNVGTGSGLSAAQVTAIYGMGHEIGWHGTTHVDITALTVGQRETQYDTGKSLIEGWTATGAACRSLAYCYGTHNATVDQETALRFDRTFLVESANKPWRQPTRGARSHNVMRLEWSTATHQRVLAAIRAAKYQDTTAVIMGHKVGAGGVLTEAEMLEGLNLAQSLGVRCLTAADALPCSNRLIDPGFEGDNLGAWVPTGNAAIAADTPSSGLGGSRVLTLTRAGAPNPEVIQSVPIDRVENHVISGRYKSTQATGFTKLLVRYLTVSNAAAAADTAINLGTPMAAWTRFTQTLTVPAGTVALQVYAWIESDGVASIDHLWLAPATHGDLG